MSLKDDPSLFAGQILSVVSDMIYILDPVDNQLDFLNSRAADLLYMESSGWKNGFDLFHSALHEDDRQRRKLHITACLSMPDGRSKEIDVRLKMQAGHYRRFRIRDMVFSRHSDDSVHQLTGIIRLLDIANPATDPQTDPATDLQAYPSTATRTIAEQKQHDLPAKLLLGLVASDYLEGLRQIYVSLEIIISTEGHLFNNASKGHLRRSQSMVQKLNLLTRDVLVNSASTDAQNGSTTVDLTGLLADISTRMAGKIAASGARIETGALPQVRGYRLLLSALFRHLILNALKSGREERPLLIAIQAGAEPSFSTITVTDNGNGFDPADREKIFGMSYQGLDKPKNRSSGTGLAIVKRIMEIHGGFITADSIPGEGSAFTCYFPA